MEHGGSLDILALAPAPDATVAVVTDDGRTLDYGRLRHETAALAARLDHPHKALVAIEDPRRVDGLLAYLAALRCGHAVLLIEAGTARLWRQLVDSFQPDLVVARDDGRAPEVLAGDYTPRPGAGGTIWSRASAAGPIHPDLAILVRTSGSSGEPRAVRLSYDNLRSNAVAIAQALGLARTDVTVTSLPLDFVFGLSLVNSGLLAGGAVAVSTLSPSSGHFWGTLDRLAATVLGATPVTYTALRAQGWDGRAHPSLRLLLHAGGPLDEPTLRYFHQAMDGGRFVSMYGQTEASGRICCQRVRPALDDVATVGEAIPGTVVSIEAPYGEIVVRGPGVMMGYARGRADLALGDTQGGLLRTGDVGRVAAGRYYVTGRIDRQVKVLGRRIQLDDVERLLLRHGIEAAVDLDADGRLVVVGCRRELASGAGVFGSAGVSEACAEVAIELGIPRAAMTWVGADRVVHRPNGKLDRRATFERASAGGDGNARD
jgi:acyl-CoA synthetase (AMP-forming)/AMP-acid ligase II